MHCEKVFQIKARKEEMETRRDKYLQELVEERKDASEDDSHEVVTESHDRDVGVILVGDNGGDLRNRRVLLFLEDDGLTFSIKLLVDEFFVSRVFLLLFGHGCGDRGEGGERGRGLVG
jgi:hypothetical protein